MLIEGQEIEGVTNATEGEEIEIIHIQILGPRQIKTPQSYINKNIFSRYLWINLFFFQCASSNRPSKILHVNGNTDFLSTFFLCKLCTIVYNNVHSKIQFQNFYCLPCAYNLSAGLYFFYYRTQQGIILYYFLKTI